MSRAAKRVDVRQAGRPPLAARAVATGRPPFSTRGFGIAIVTASAAVLTAHARYYYPFLADDALISLRYVQRFLGGKGLTWTDGPPVEGYSNLLWMLLTAALGATGLDLITCVRFLGFAATMGVVLAFTFGFLRGSAVSVAITALCASIWVLAGSNAAWALAGLEQPLVACLLAWALVLILRRTTTLDATPRSFFAPGVLLGCICLTRPDGPLFATVFGLWLLLRGKSRRAAFRNSAWLGLAPIAMIAAQLMFRRLYYDDWLPNVAYVKISPSATHALDGLKYLAGGIGALRPIGELSLLAIGTLCWRRSTRSHGVLLMALCVAWAAYLCFIGGDIFPAWRHMLPMLIVFLVADMLALEQWATSKVPWVRRGWLAILVALAWFVVNQFRNEKNQAAKNELWEWNGQVVGLVLQRGFASQQPLLAVTASGAVPYWSRLPALDLFGLADRHIARTRPPDWGEGMLGHEAGDAAYMLSRKPDLILFGTPGGREPTGTYGRELSGMPEFDTDYDYCIFSGTVPFEFNSRILVRRDSDKIGIVRRAGEILVPPYLLNLTGGALAQLDSRDRFFVVVTAQAPVGIGELEIPVGRWSLADPSPSLRLRIADSNTKVLLPEEAGGAGPCIPVTTAGTYIVLIESTSPELVPVYGLHLRSE